MSRRRTVRMAVGAMAASVVGAVTVGVAGGAYAQQFTGVTNSGSGAANTGGNQCIGNASQNSVGTGDQITQGGLIGLGLVLGGSNNASTGTCKIETGDAAAVGNHSGTVVGQNRGAGGGYGGSQAATVSNQGSGTANTGGNTCVGNASKNDVGTGDQVTQGGLIGLGLVVGGSNNYSAGSCDIKTGDAAAVGNNSGTVVGQNRGGGAGGYGGTQAASVSNAGNANANTGGNTCVGNASTNNVGTGDQVTQGGLIGLGLVVGGSNNYSTGACSVTTGDAAAVGNQSGTTVGQNAAGGTGGWFWRPATQAAGVSNSGTANANTGGNTCIGNASTNNVGGSQTSTGGLLGLGLTLGGPNNVSQGTCSITTGDAAAVGNSSGTVIGQNAAPGGAAPHGYVYQPHHNPYPAPQQVAAVGNQGQAAANTGNNTAVGNNSSTQQSSQQSSSGGLIGAGITAGGPSNNSSGSASIQTGNAAAFGNQSSTQAFQAFGG